MNLLLGAKKGDDIEFLSDEQTKNGPSTGSILDSNLKTLTIKHGDKIEIFNKDSLKLFNVRFADSNRKQNLWILY